MPPPCATPSELNLSVDGQAGPRTAGEVVFAFLARRERFVVVIALLLFFALMLRENHVKRLWYDEFFTMTVAMQPDWRHFAAAMIPDGNPPLGTLLTGVFVRLLGASTLSLRLPQMLGFTGALAGLYVFVKRECGPVYGLVAMAIVLSLPAWQYALEGRPYGLLLFFFMLALTGWQAASHTVQAQPGRSRAVALAVMFLGIVGCILSHNFGIITVGTPLLAGEVARILQRRRLDLPVLVAGLAGACAIFITLPMIHRTRQVLTNSQSIIGRPITLHGLHNYFQWFRRFEYQIIDERTVTALLVAIVLCWRVGPRFWGQTTQTREGDPTAVGLRLYIFAAMLGAIALLPVTWLSMIPTGGYYSSRYGIGMVMGLAGTTCLVFAFNRVSQTVISIVLGVALCTFAISYHVYTPEYPLDQKVLDKLESTSKGTPIIVQPSFLYPGLWWNASPELKQRIYYLTDMHEQNVLEGVALTMEQPFTPAPMEDLDTFARAHDHAFVLCDPGVEACLARLRSAGYTARPVDETMRYFEVQKHPAPADDAVR